MTFIGKMIGRVRDAILLRRAMKMAWKAHGDFVTDEINTDILRRAFSIQDRLYLDTQEDINRKNKDALRELLGSNDPVRRGEVEALCSRELLGAYKEDLRRAREAAELLDNGAPDNIDDDILSHVMRLADDDPVDNLVTIDINDDGITFLLNGSWVSHMAMNKELSPYENVEAIQDLLSRLDVSYDRIEWGQLAGTFGSTWGVPETIEVTSETFGKIKDMLDLPSEPNDKLNKLTGDSLD